MAKLPVSSAARAFGMSRSTLRGIIRRGGVHVAEGNLVDTAELEKAGYRPQPEALAIEETGQQGKRPAPTLQKEILLQAPDLFRQIQAEFQRELAAAHARQLRLLHLMGELNKYVNIAGRIGRIADLDALPQPQMREPILTLLRNAPQPLTRQEIETALNSPKGLRNVLQGMYREGLVARPKPGLYTIGSKQRRTGS